MDTKTIVYTVYLLAMFVNGVVAVKAGLSFRNWQYWFLMFIPIVTYLCGYVGGG